MLTNYFNKLCSFVYIHTKTWLKYKINTSAIFLKKLTKKLCFRYLLVGAVHYANDYYMACIKIFWKCIMTWPGK